MREGSLSAMWEQLPPEYEDCHLPMHDMESLQITPLAQSADRIAKFGRDRGCATGRSWSAHAAKMAEGVARILSLMRPMKRRRRRSRKSVGTEGGLSAYPQQHHQQLLFGSVCGFGCACFAFVGRRCAFERWRVLLASGRGIRLLSQHTTSTALLWPLVLMLCQLVDLFLTTRDIPSRLR